MNKKVVFILVCSIILTGCKNVKKNQIKNVEELEKTKIIKVQTFDNNEKNKEIQTLNGVDKNMVEYYISDLYFYNEKDGVDFCYFVDKKRLHIAILDAYYTNNLLECGEYFAEHSADILEARKYVLEHELASDKNLTYLCIKIQLTNQEEALTEFAISTLKPYSRIKDDRLIEYGLADAYIDLPLIYSEPWYDYSKKKSGKSSHFFNMQAGETTDIITVVYLVDKEKISEDLYLGLNLGTPQYNSKFGCDFPPNDEDTKFLKINLR